MPRALIAIILVSIAIFTLRFHTATAPHQGQPRRVATPTEAVATQTVIAGQTADAYVMATLTAIAAPTTVRGTTGGAPVAPAQAMATGTASAEHVAALNAYCNSLATSTTPTPGPGTSGTPQFSPDDCAPPSN
jgi:hypothetical protein